MDASDSSGASSWARRLGRYAGVAATIACCVYVGSLLGSRFEDLWPRFRSTAFLASVGLGSLMWIGLNCFLGLSWRQWVLAQACPVSLRDSVVVALRAQVAKYLPGNVFHFAGRIVLARQLGVPTAVASRAVIGEAALLVGVGVVLAAPVSGRLDLSIGRILIFVAVALAGVAIAAILKRKDLAKLIATFRAQRGRALVSLGAIVAVFFMQTWIFVGIGQAIDLPLSDDWFRSLSVVSAAWVAGFVVIGSPGGLGVREYVFSLFATGREDQATMLLVAASLRLCAVIGDVASALIGLALARRAASGQSNGQPR